MYGKKRYKELIDEYQCEYCEEKDIIFEDNSEKDLTSTIMTCCFDGPRVLIFKFIPIKFED